MLFRCLHCNLIILLRCLLGRVQTARPGGGPACFPFASGAEQVQRSLFAWDNLLLVFCATMSRQILLLSETNFHRCSVSWVSLFSFKCIDGLLSEKERRWEYTDGYSCMFKSPHQGWAVTCRWKWRRPLTSRFCSPHSKVINWHTQSHQKVAINQWQLLYDSNRISRLLEVKLGRKVPPRPIVAGEPLLTVRCLSEELLGNFLYS